jgi:hypothetical protein
VTDTVKVIVSVIVHEICLPETPETPQLVIMETQFGVAKQSLDDSYWVQRLGIAAIRVRMEEWLKLPLPVPA